MRSTHSRQHVVHTGFDLFRDRSTRSGGKVVRRGTERRDLGDHVGAAVVGLPFFIEHKTAFGHSVRTGDDRGQTADDRVGHSVVGHIVAVLGFLGVVLNMGDVIHARHSCDVLVHGDRVVRLHIIDRGVGIGNAAARHVFQQREHAGEHTLHSGASAPGHKLDRVDLGFEIFTGVVNGLFVDKQRCAVIDRSEAHAGVDPCRLAALEQTGKGTVLRRLLLGLVAVCHQTREEDHIFTRKGVADEVDLVFGAPVRHHGFAGVIFAETLVAAGFGMRLTVVHAVAGQLCIKLAGTMPVAARGIKHRRNAGVAGFTPARKGVAVEHAPILHAFIGILRRILVPALEAMDEHKRIVCLVGSVVCFKMQRLFELGQRDHQHKDRKDECVEFANEPCEVIKMHKKLSFQSENMIE